AYRFHVTMIDSTSGSPSKTTMGDSVSLVVASGVKYKGQDSVIELLNDSGQTTSDTTFYKFESNGDVSVYIPGFGASGFNFASPTPWIRLPFGSQKTNDTLFVEDTNINVSGTSLSVHLVAVTSYVGTEELDVNGPPIAKGGVAKVLIIATVFGQPITATVTYSIDPSIGGYFHSITDLKVPTIVILTGNTHHKDKTMTSFTLVK
ncbi:MAG TPA: hypothetical protein VET48_12200, partial [Steroidobacteraceae bacterium]|nr:hypothetical protein [Steroidobacteraceae bacterium]